MTLEGAKFIPKQQVVFCILSQGYWLDDVTQGRWPSAEYDCQVSMPEEGIHIIFVYALLHFSSWK